jgi:hypothetical protein
LLHRNKNLEKEQRSANSGGSVLSREFCGENLMQNRQTLKYILIVSFLMMYGFCYCSYDDSTFIDKCYFSDDGKWVLVSELNFVRPHDNSDRFPVFGLYTIGDNELNNRILMSEDSIYFFDKLLHPVDLPRKVDSVFDKKTFLNKYHFNSGGINVTKLIKFKIDERFVREVNTIELMNLDQNSGTSFSAANTKYFDFFINFFYNNRAFFTDTLLNSYADKKHLIEGLNEVEKKEIYTKKDNLFVGTQGYGTRVYTNSDNTLFFIRTKYDISSYVKVTSYGDVLQIDPVTKKEVVIKTKSTFDNMDTPLEKRVLLKNSR